MYSKVKTSSGKISKRDTSDSSSDDTFSSKSSSVESRFMSISIKLNVDIELGIFDSDIVSILQPTARSKTTVVFINYHVGGYGEYKTLHAHITVGFSLGNHPKNTESMMTKKLTEYVKNVCGDVGFFKDSIKCEFKFGDIAVSKLLDYMYKNSLGEYPTFLQNVPNSKSYNDIDRLMKVMIDNKSYIYYKPPVLVSKEEIVGDIKTECKDLTRNSPRTNKNIKTKMIDSINRWMVDKGLKKDVYSSMFRQYYKNEDDITMIDNVYLTEQEFIRRFSNDCAGETHLYCLPKLVRNIYQNNDDYCLIPSFCGDHEWIMFGDGYLYNTHTGKIGDRYNGTIEPIRVTKQRFPSEEDKQKMVDILKSSFSTTKGNDDNVNSETDRLLSKLSVLLRSSDNSIYPVILTRGLHFGKNTIIYYLLSEILYIEPIGLTSKGLEINNRTTPFICVKDTKGVFNESSVDEDLWLNVVGMKNHTTPLFVSSFSKDKSGYDLRKSDKHIKYVSLVLELLSNYDQYLAYTDKNEGREKADKSKTTCILDVRYRALKLLNDDNMDAMISSLRKCSNKEEQHEVIFEHSFGKSIGKAKQLESMLGRVDIFNHNPIEEYYIKEIRDDVEGHGLALLFLIADYANKTYDKEKALSIGETLDNHKKRLEEKKLKIENVEEKKFIQTEIRDNCIKKLSEYKRREFPRILVGYKGDTAYNAVYQKYLNLFREGRVTEAEETAHENALPLEHQKYFPNPLEVTLEFKNVLRKKYMENVTYEEYRRAVKRYYVNNKINFTEQFKYYTGVVEGKRKHEGDTYKKLKSDVTEYEKSLYDDYLFCLENKRLAQNKDRGGKILKKKLENVMEDATKEYSGMEVLEYMESIISESENDNNIIFDILKEQQLSVNQFRDDDNKRNINKKLYDSIVINPFYDSRASVNIAPGESKYDKILDYELVRGIKPEE